MISDCNECELEVDVDLSPMDGSGWMVIIWFGVGGWCVLCGIYLAVCVLFSIGTGVTPGHPPCFGTIQRRLAWPR